MSRYYVTCNYVQGRWVGKQIMPVTDNYESYETIVTVTSKEKVYGAVLGEILRHTKLKCVKVVNLNSTLL